MNSQKKWIKIDVQYITTGNSLRFSDARINVRFGVMTLNVALFS